ncbi:DUF4384 domain-containing protein [Dapis sp. BLCC M229]|uniref:DUF4384 domain-containing protein n=1 Tax=Dapis sp. BLCC M229 TaxID=3400188 RepID=UPI003CE89F33
MASSNYKDNEKEFLQNMAVKFCFSDNTEIAFFERLYNTDVGSWEKLANLVGDTLRENSKKKTNENRDNSKKDENDNENKDNSKKDENDVDVVKLLRDRWDKKICPDLAPIMAKDGYQFNGKNKWQLVRKWLIEVKYPEWLKEKQKLEGILPIPQLLTVYSLWEELKFRTNPTEKMGPRVQKISDMDMYEADSDYPNSVPLGSHIKFEVQLERLGYLTLLEKGTSGKLYCLSPSFLAPAPHFNQTGVISLPQEGAPKNSFKLTGKPGVEEIIAAIAPERPKLDWLPKPDQPPLLLQGKHLQEFLVYFEGKSDCTLWYMDYQVV